MMVVIEHPTVFSWEERWKKKIVQEAIRKKAAACQSCQLQQGLSGVVGSHFLTPTADNVSVRVRCAAVGEFIRPKQAEHHNQCPLYCKWERRRQNQR